MLLLLGGEPAGIRMVGDPGGVRISTGGDVPSCPIFGMMIGAGKFGTSVVAFGGYNTTLLLGGSCASMVVAPASPSGNSTKFWVAFTIVLRYR